MRVFLKRKTMRLVTYTHTYKFSVFEGLASVFTGVKIYTGSKAEEHTFDARTASLRDGRKE